MFFEDGNSERERKQRARRSEGECEFVREREERANERAIEEKSW